MKQSKQAKFSFRAKTRLLEQGRTIADLAREIDRPRTTVSQAIHQNRFPKVRQQIEVALSL